MNLFAIIAALCCAWMVMQLLQSMFPKFFEDKQALEANTPRLLRHRRIGEDYLLIVHWHGQERQYRCTVCNTTCCEVGCLTWHEYPSRRRASLQEENALGRIWLQINWDELEASHNEA